MKFKRKNYAEKLFHQFNKYLSPRFEGDGRRWSHHCHEGESVDRRDKCRNHRLLMLFPIRLSSSYAHLWLGIVIGTSGKTGVSDL